MFKFTGEHKETYERLKNELESAKDDMSDAISEFNDTMRDAVRKLRRTENHLNSTITDCENFREEVILEMEEYIETLEECSEERKEVEHLTTLWAEAVIFGCHVESPDEIEETDIDTKSFDELEIEVKES